MQAIFPLADCANVYAGDASRALDPPPKAADSRA